MQLHYQSDENFSSECILSEEGSHNASLPSFSGQPVHFLSITILCAQLDTVGSPEQRVENINCKGVHSLT